MRKNCLPYPVETVENAFADGQTVLQEMLRKVSGSDNPRVLIVADHNVVARMPDLGSRIGKWVQTSGIALADSPVIVAGGEHAKGPDLTPAMGVARAMLNAKIGLHDAVLIIGGGAVLDVAGWVAAQVRGGVPVVRMPTTPAAMVDAAFAEFAAMDATGMKDSMRVPSRPAGVVVDWSYLPTVFDGVWRTGYVEALRLAVVTDAPLTKKLIRLAPEIRSRSLAVMRDVILSAIAVRQKKGGTDFALWAAHRLEAMSEYKIPHGYAVTLGIYLDTAYAVARGVMREVDRQAICEALQSCGVLEGALHSRSPFEEDALLHGLDAWKLSTGSERIALPSALGKCAYDEIPDRATMTQAINLIK